MQKFVSGTEGFIENQIETLSAKGWRVVPNTLTATLVQKNDGYPGRSWIVYSCIVEKPEIQITKGPSVNSNRN